MNEKMKIALLCFDNPFLKPAEGGKRAMMTRILSLSGMADAEVDVYLLCKTAEGQAADFRGLERSMTFFQYTMNRFRPGMLASRYPICVCKRYVKECAQELLRHEYDAAIYEGEQIAAYRTENAVRAKTHILYFHDIESDYRRAVADTAADPLRRAANRLESRKFARMEADVARWFDAFWFISHDECRTIREKTGNAVPCTYLPIPAAEIADEPVRGARAPQLLYVGDLSVTHNFLSLKWFVNEVLTRVAQEIPEVRCTVVGRIGEENRKTLENERVRVLGYVDDLDEVYRGAACLILPVLYGAGVKVKVIDALGKGQIVLTTKKGVEGTELESGKHLLASDEPDELARLCAAVLRDRERYLPLAEEGLRFIRENHSVARQTELMHASLCDLLGRRGSDK